MSSSDGSERVILDGPDSPHVVVPGRQYRHLIWDLGGTIFDTYTELNEVLHSLVKAHIDFDLSDVAQLARISTAHAMKCLSTISEVAQSVFEKAVAELKNSWMTTPPPLMPGVGEVMQAVAAAGGMNLVVTHRDRESATALLDSTDLPVDDMICESDGFERKPKPQMFTTILARNGVSSKLALAVGDRPIDAVGADAAGVDSRLLNPDGKNPAFACDEIDSTWEDIQIGALTDLIPLIAEPGTCDGEESPEEQ